MSDTSLSTYLKNTTSSSSFSILSSQNVKHTHTWKIHNFSLLPLHSDDSFCYKSKTFQIENGHFTLHMRPNNAGSDKETLFFWIVLNSIDSLEEEEEEKKDKIILNYRFRLVHPSENRHADVLLGYSRKKGEFTINKNTDFSFTATRQILNDRKFFANKEDVLIVQLEGEIEHPPFYQVSSEFYLGPITTTTNKVDSTTWITCLLEKKTEYFELWKEKKNCDIKFKLLCSEEEGEEKEKEEIKGLEEEQEKEIEDPSLILAHSSILMARSSVFAAMLHHNMKEKEEKTIEIAVTNRNTLLQMLYYLYTEELPEPSNSMNINTWKEAFELYQLANQYDLSNLCLVCVHKIVEYLDSKNVLQILFYFQKYKNEHGYNLIKDAGSKILFTNMEEVLFLSSDLISFKEDFVINKKRKE